MGENKTGKSNFGTTICIIIIILLVIALCMMYYYYNYMKKNSSDNNLVSNSKIENTVNEDKNDKKQENKQDNKQINKIEDEEDLVYNAKTEMKIYNFIEGKEEYKDVDVPQINLNYDSIKKLNDEIIDFTKGFQRDDFDVKYYINDEIISLVLTYYTEGDPYYIFIYNIDSYTGNILTNEELLYKIGMNNDLEEKIDEAVDKVLEENTLNEEFDPDRVWYTMSEVCNDYTRGLQRNIPMFINENGKLSIVVQYCAPAGSGGPWGVIVEL